MSLQLYEKIQFWYSFNKNFCKPCQKNAFFMVAKQEDKLFCCLFTLIFLGQKAKLFIVQAVCGVVKELKKNSTIRWSKANFANKAWTKSWQVQPNTTWQIPPSKVRSSFFLFSWIWKVGNTTLTIWRKKSYNEKGNPK